MNARQLTAIAIFLCLASSSFAQDPIPISELQRSTDVSFNKEVLPVLRKHCLACHSASEKQGELVLETAESILRGGEMGPAVVAGNVAESRLLKLAAHQQEPFMPPPKNDVAAESLSAEELGLIKLWIAQGCKTDSSNALLSPQKWHPLPPGVNAIHAAVVSSDGQYVACSRANQISIYHVPSGKLVTRLTDPQLQMRSGDPREGIAHLDVVESLAFNEQGDLLASGAFREVKLWRRPRDVHPLQLASGVVEATGISDDRKWLAAAGADHAIKLWRLDDATAAVTCTGHKDKVTRIVFLPDGQRFVSSSLDQTICVWNIADGKLLGKIESPAPVNSVEWVARTVPMNDPASDMMLVSGGSDNLLRCWNVPAITPSSLASVPLDATRMAASHDIRLLAVSSDDGTITVLDAQTSQIINTWKASASISGIAFNQGPPAGASPHILLTFSADGVVRLWDADTGSALDVITTALLVPKAAAVSFDGNLVAVGFETGGIWLWNRSATTPAKLDFPLPVTDLAFHPDGQTVFATASDGTLRAFRISDGQSTFATNHGSAIHRIAVSHSGQWLATAGENGQLRVWQSANGGPAPAAPTTNFRGPVRMVAFSADDTKVIGASIGDTAEQIAYDVNTGAALQRYTGHAKPVTAMVAGGPGDQVITLAPTEGAQAWQLSAGKTFPGHGQPITALAAVRSTAMQIFSGSVDTTIRRWELENGQQLQQFNHGAAITSISVRPDGLRLAAAGNSNVARLWNIENNQQIAELRGDVRARTLVTRMNQQLQTQTSRLALAKQRLDAADQGLPIKVAAEKTAADALLAANKSVEEKLAVVRTTMDAKVAQEKLAIEAAAAAQKATQARDDAEKLAKETALAAQRAQERAGRLATASQQNPNDKDLAAAAMTAQTEATQIAAKAQEATAAQQAPTQAASQATQVANDAAAKVADVQKPYNDALTALKQAEMVQNLASQEQVIAARELQAAQAEQPAAKEAYTATEAALNQAKLQLDAANQAATAAEQLIWSTAFSPDGRLLATAGQLTSAHTWDSDTGQPIAAYAGHTGPLRSALFIDDQRLVSTSDDQSSFVWEVNPSWQLLRTIGSVDDGALFSHRVMAVDFSRDGQLLATGGGIPSRRGEIHVFQVEDGRPLLTIPEAHLDSVFSVRFSPDGRRLASAGADKYLRTFDLTSGQLLRRFEGHTNYVLGVAWKSDAQLLASCSADMTIKVWNPDTGDQIQTIIGFAKPVTSVRFIGDSDNVVSASGDKIVRMHNANNTGNFRNFSGPTGYLHTIDITPGSEVLVGGGQDSSLWMWDGNNGQLRFQIEP